MQAKSQKKLKNTSKHLQQKFDRLSTLIHTFSNTSGTDVRKNYSDYFAKFTKLTNTFCDITVQIWDTKTNYFKSNYKWPKGWNLKIFVSCADIINTLSERFTMEDTQDAIITLFNRVFTLEVYAESSDKKIPNTVLKPKVIPNPNIVSRLSSLLYAPLDFLADNTPLPTGVMLGAGLHLLATRTNFSLLNTGYQHSMRYLSVFWQQAKKFEYPSLPAITSKDFTKENIIPGLQIAAASFLCGYLLHYFFNSDSEEEIQIPHQISAAIEEYKDWKKQQPKPKNETLIERPVCNPLSK